MEFGSLFEKHFWGDRFAAYVDQAFTRNFFLRIFSTRPSPTRMPLPLRACMGEEKHSLRVRLLLRRESLSASQVGAWSSQIQQRLIQSLAYARCRSVALYSPAGNEVGTELVRDHALSTGKKLFYPRLKVAKDEMPEFVQVESPEDLEPGRYGILEPKGRNVLTTEDQEALIVAVPGLAFDLEGHRLGRGGGWYDRALSALGDAPRVIALSYEFQILEKLPVNAWDRNVDTIITEQRTIHCEKSLRQGVSSQ